MPTPAPASAMTRPRLAAVRRDEPVAAAAADDAVEHISGGLLGVRVVEKMREIRTVHDVLSKRRGGSFAHEQFRTRLHIAARWRVAAAAEGTAAAAARLRPRHSGVEAAGPAAARVVQERAQEEATSW